MNPIDNLLRRFFGRTALLFLVLQGAGCGDKEKEKAPATVPPSTSQSQPSLPATQPPVPKPAAAPLTSLESLVAPIALYPDPLLAEVLVAATYPFEVVQAARWLETKPDLATVREKNWDASVVRLTAVPDVIATMDKHLDWTTQLGDAFLSNPSQLMDTIQTLRKRARDAGFLKDNDLQKVEAQTVSATPAQGQDPSQAGEVKATPAVLTKEVISIKPAKADTLSVPSYNPEVVYAAPMAPPPAAVQAYPAASYYPTYAPPVATTTTTTTSSDTDQWMSFGTGALVGGLLTWGIMEWADDDDWDDYHVGHYYGNAVCHGGNCWHGGGGYYGGGRYGNAYVNRGNINADRNINISGNEINFNRDGTFRPEQLPALRDQSNRWRPDPSHRRGQAFPPAAQERLGRTETPALAGNRLSGVQNLPANMRGFGGAAAADRMAPARLSSDAVRQQLASKPGRVARPGNLDNQLRPSSRRENALEGLRNSGQRNAVESNRGASSLRSRQAKGGPSRPAGAAPRRSESIASGSPRRSAQTPQRQEQFARQRNEQSQRLQAQRRQEMSRPNAFESSRHGSRTAAFSQRGNASMSRAGTGFSRSQPAARQGSSFGGQRAPRSGGAARGGGRGGLRR